MMMKNGNPATALPYAKAWGRVATLPCAMAGIRFPLSSRTYKYQEGGFGERGD